LNCDEGKISRPIKVNEYKKKELIEQQNVTNKRLRNNRGSTETKTNKKNATKKTTA